MKYHRIERSYGSFAKTFSLPDVIEVGKVKAEFKDGVLNLHLPKSEKAKPKAIEVKVAQAVQTLTNNKARLISEPFVSEDIPRFITFIV